MEVELKDNKKYLLYNLVGDTSLFKGYLSDYVVPQKVLQSLSKDLGFSYDTYLSLLSLDEKIADSLIILSSKKHNYENIVLLLDEENKEVLGYSLETRLPLLNSEFMHRVASLIETVEGITIDEYHYSSEDNISTVLLSRTAPVLVEKKYVNSPSETESYKVGILLVNDELSSTYSRLVLYVDEEPLYLPASYYNATTSRYKKTTQNSTEALEVLCLKVFDDLAGTAVEERIYELYHSRLRIIERLVATYEEYSTLLRAMRKIPTVIEDNTLIEEMIHLQDKCSAYGSIEDKKDSYIWRCTALLGIDLLSLIKHTSSILESMNAPCIEYYQVREILGSYLSTKRIVEESAYTNLKEE